MPVCTPDKTRTAVFARALAAGLLATGLFACAPFAEAACIGAQEPGAAQTTPTAAQTTERGPGDPRPIAIVSLDAKTAGSAAEVTGAMRVYNGRAFIAANGTVTSGDHTAQVTLPYRGTLRVCASTAVRLSTDSTVPAGEIPGLMMAMDHGAIEASFATGRNSDILMTPDFRILIGGPGAAEVKVRLGPNGDTCVDNSGDAPYVLVTSVFDGGAYRVQSRQRVMFQHGSLHEVIDQEKEPCGCPPAAKGGNEFPLAQSEGLAPLFHPDKNTSEQVGHEAQSSESLSYNSVDHAPKAADTQPEATATPAAPAPDAAATAGAEPPPPEIPPATPAKKQKKAGFFKHIGNFFRKVFGAE